ncbi:TrmH family RNA methyltransferase [bacterium]|nr:TrmH family RNA methyltransferase [bacterium]
MTQPTGSNRLTLGQARGLERMPVFALLDNIRSAWNIGAMFRTADASALSGIYLSGMCATPPRPDIEKTALGATEMVPWSYSKDPVEIINSLKDEGIAIVALEQVEGAKQYVDFEYPFPCCFVVGNEVEGVSAEVAKQADYAVEIPMSGAKQSLNVAVSFGVMAFEIRRQWNARQRRLITPE